MFINLAQNQVVYSSHCARHICSQWLKCQQTSCSPLSTSSVDNPWLNAVETLQLLPPLVMTQDVKAFLIESVHTPIFNTKVIHQISRARKDQVSRKLMVLQSNRVKVTDSWMWVGMIIQNIFFCVDICCRLHLPAISQANGEYCYCGSCPSVCFQ